MKGDEERSGNAAAQANRCNRLDGLDAGQPTPLAWKCGARTSGSCPTARQGAERLRQRFHNPRCACRLQRRTLRRCQCVVWRQGWPAVPQSPPADCCGVVMCAACGSVLPCATVDTATAPATGRHDRDTEHRIASSGRQRGSGAEGEAHTGVVVRRSFLLRLPGLFPKLNMPMTALGRRTALCRRGAEIYAAAASTVVQGPLSAGSANAAPPEVQALPLQMRCCL